jgi:adenylate kinase
MGKVILLTGAPSTGKSTLRRNLVARIHGLTDFDYGELLRQKKAREGTTISYEQLRNQSASVIQPTDVASLDESLIDQVAKMRLSSHIIIDSHAVTRESFGFRAVPFSHDQLKRLQLDGVLVLRCPIHTVLSRSAVAPEGRREVSPDLAAEHQVLQECVGMIYAVICGCPIYILDVANLDEEGVAARATEVIATMGVRPTVAEHSSQA